MRLVLKICFTFLLTVTLSNCSLEKVNVNNEDYILIQQNGNHYNNGFHHGELLRKEIKSNLATWKENMKTELSLSTEEMIDLVYTKTNFISTIKTHCPELIEEVKGIAKGAGVDEKLLMCYNLGEEIYNYKNKPIESCSNFGIELKDERILFYNQDLPLFLHGNNKPVILKHENYLVFTLPGLVALSGISRYNAVSCNSLPMLKMNTRGLPLPFAIRKLLTLKSDKTIDTFFSETPLAIPQNVIIASENRLIGFEISKNETCKYEPENGMIYHTNFPLINTDYNYSDYSFPSCQRFNMLDSITSINKITKEVIQTIFSSEPISNSETYLRFIVSFKNSETPNISFINPKKSDKINIIKL